MKMVVNLKCYSVWRQACLSPAVRYSFMNINEKEYCTAIFDEIIEGKLSTVMKLP